MSMFNKVCDEDKCWPPFDMYTFYQRSLDGERSNHHGAREALIEVVLALSLIQWRQVSAEA